MLSSPLVNHTNSSGRIYIGACGYAYPQWRESGFYPQDIKAGHMLAFYAQKFPITELNETWYQMPRPEAMERLLEQTPGGFLFAAKLHRSLSHEPDSARISSQTAAFRYGLSPLTQAKRLAAVLLQFPESFDRSMANRRRLTSLLGHLAGLPLAVEFRHRSWAVDKVFREMEKRQVVLTIPDTPDLPELFSPSVTIAPDRFFYVRFHGRNPIQWRRKGIARFTYDYTEAELQAWIEQRLAGIVGQDLRGFIFFNNYAHGQAVRNASVLAQLLDTYGFELGKI